MHDDSVSSIQQSREFRQAIMMLSAVDHTGAVVIHATGATTFLPHAKFGPHGSRPSN